MTHSLYKVQALDELNLDTINTFIKELNDRLEEITQRFSEIGGDKGQVAKIINDLDMDGNLVKNLKKLQFTKRVLSVKSAGLIASGGTAADAITDPADAPANADILRDDLVANTLPSIATALDNLATAINEIIQVLRTRGLTS